MLTKAAGADEEDDEVGEPPESVSLEIRSSSDDLDNALEQIQPRKLEDEPWLSQIMATSIRVSYIITKELSLEMNRLMSRRSLEDDSTSFLGPEVPRWQSVS